MIIEIKKLFGLIIVCCLTLNVLNAIWPGTIYFGGDRYFMVIGIIFALVNYCAYWMTKMFVKVNCYFYFGVSFLLANLLLFSFWSTQVGKWEILVSLMIVMGLVNFIFYLLFRYEGKKIDSRG